MSAEKFTDGSKPKVNRVEVYWHTVTYRTIVLYVLAFVILCAGRGSSIWTARCR